MREAPQTAGLLSLCPRHDSNVRLLPPEGSALSTELRGPAGTDYRTVHSRSRGAFTTEPAQWDDSRMRRTVRARIEVELRDSTDLTFAIAAAAGTPFESESVRFELDGAAVEVTELIEHPG